MPGWKSALVLALTGATLGVGTTLAWWPADEPQAVVLEAEDETLEVIAIEKTEQEQRGEKTEITVPDEKSRRHVVIELKKGPNHVEVRQTTTAADLQRLIVQLRMIAEELEQAGHAEGAETYRTAAKKLAEVAELPRVRTITGVGKNSDAGVTGEVTVTAPDVSIAFAQAIRRLQDKGRPNPAGEEIERLRQRVRELEEQMHHRDGHREQMPPPGHPGGERRPEGEHRPDGDHRPGGPGREGPHHEMPGRPGMGHPPAEAPIVNHLREMAEKMEREGRHDMARTLREKLHAFLQKEGREHRPDQPREGERREEEARHRGEREPGRPEADGHRPPPGPDGRPGERGPGRGDEHRPEPRHPEGVHHRGPLGEHHPGADHRPDMHHPEADHRPDMAPPHEMLNDVRNQLRELREEIHAIRRLLEERPMTRMGGPPGRSGFQPPLRGRGRPASRDDDDDDDHKPARRGKDDDDDDDDGDDDDHGKEIRGSQKTEARREAEEKPGDFQRIGELLRESQSDARLEIIGAEATILEVLSDADPVPQDEEEAKEPEATDKGEQAPQE